MLPDSAHNAGFMERFSDPFCPEKQQPQLSYVMVRQAELEPLLPSQQIELLSSCSVLDYSICRVLTSSRGRCRMVILNYVGRNLGRRWSLWMMEEGCSPHLMKRFCLEELFPAVDWQAGFVVVCNSRRLRR